MENRRNNIQEEHDRLLNDSTTDIFTKVELSKALIENIDELVIDLMATRHEVKREIENLETERDATIEEYRK